MSDEIKMDPNSIEGQYMAITAKFKDLRDAVDQLEAAASQIPNARERGIPMYAGQIRLHMHEAFHFIRDVAETAVNAGE